MDSFQEQLNLSPDNCPGTTREPGAMFSLQAWLKSHDMHVPVIRNP